MKYARRIVVLAIAMFIGLVIVATPRSDAYEGETCYTWYELPGECLSASTVDYLAEQNQRVRNAEDDKRVAEKYAQERDNYWSQQMLDQEQNMQFTIDYWREEANLRLSRFDELMAEKIETENKLNQRISGLLYKVWQKNQIIRQLKREIRHLIAIR